MILGYIKDENGKFVHKFVEESEKNNPDILFHVGATFGEYIWTDEEHIEQAKAALLEQMFDAIRDLAKLDSFWIVKAPSYWNAFCHPDNLVDPVPQAAKEGKTSIAWKINFPQMEGYYPWGVAEYLQKQIDERLISK